MTDTRRPTLGELALEVRSKNAGPFWVTMELFMPDAEGYVLVADEEFINEQVIGRLYAVDPAVVQLFRIPALNVVKVSFPRPVAQGSLRDRDVHAGQHHVPLASLVPSGRPAGTGAGGGTGGTRPTVVEEPSTPAGPGRRPSRTR